MATPSVEAPSGLPGQLARSGLPGRVGPVGSGRVRSGRFSDLPGDLPCDLPCDLPGDLPGTSRVPPVTLADDDTTATIRVLRTLSQASG